MQVAAVSPTLERIQRHARDCSRRAVRNREASGSARGVPLDPGSFTYASTVSKAVGDYARELSMLRVPATCPGPPIHRRVCASRSGGSQGNWIGIEACVSATARYGGVAAACGGGVVGIWGGQVLGLAALIGGGSHEAGKGSPATPNARNNKHGAAARPSCRHYRPMSASTC